MIRALPILLLSLTLLAPMPVAAQEGTATPPAPSSALADPGRIATAIVAATPPASLPGNEDAVIELHTWEEHYGQGLANTIGAWVLTGSPQFPIASVIVFETPENAQAGLGDFAVESAFTEVGGLEAYTVADRGKWICIATDGPVLIIGQAEPSSSTEDQDAVRDRSCEAMLATDRWVRASVSGVPASPPAG